ncbi:MAG: transcriptional repressor NrdR [Clostridia bacterium]|nr:transcriptional repressor NrdR [Clostridia bacterium]
MKCNKCGCLDSKVIDSRLNEEGTSIRRRRECLGCGKRFTTYEVIESIPVLVVKRDGARQTFDTEKIRRGIIKACEKRPVTAEQVNSAVDRIEKQIYNTLLQEISSKQIGELVMLELKNIDEVAYVRFASVYRDFRDVTTFVEFIGDLERIIKEEKVVPKDENK